MLEKDLVKKIIEYLRSLPNCYCWKEHGGQYGTAGVPDVIACVSGRFVAFEVKVGKNKPTKLQEHTIEKIKKAGGTATVVYSLDEVKQTLREMEVNDVQKQ